MKNLFSFFTNLPQINKIVFFIGLIGIIASTVGINLVHDESMVRYFDNMHWTFGTVSAAVLASFGYRNSRSAPSHKTAYWFFLAFSGYALGQIIWDIQSAFSYSIFPSPSDLFYLSLGPCMTIALFYEVRSQSTKINQTMFWLDLIALSVAALTLVLVSYLPRTGGMDTLSMVVLVSYPITLLVPILMVFLLIPSMRLRFDGRLFFFLIGITITAWSWMHWNSLALDGVTTNGSWFNTTFSIAILIAGLVVSDWKLAFSNNKTYDRISEAFLRFLPITTVVLTSIAIIMVGSTPLPNVLVEELIYFGGAIVIILAIIRQSRQLQERDRLLEIQSEALKSANLIKTIIQTAPLRIFWKDRDLNYLGCNDLFAHDAGFEHPDQMIGKSDFEMGWKDQAELYRADDFRVMESGNSTVGYEEPQTTPDGNQIWLRTSKVPLIDTSTGETIGIVGIYDDITTQRQASERLHYALNGSRDGLWDWDMKTDKVYYSPRWLEILGYQYGDFPETLDTWGMLVHPEDKEQTLSKITDYLEGRIDKFEIEFRMKHKDGHWVDILSRAKFAVNNQGHLLEPRRIVGTHSDISEKKKMETVLRQKELYQRALLDNFPHLVWLKDTEGHFLVANKPLALAAGLENAEQMVGATDFDVFPKDLAEAYRADDNEVLKNRAIVEREEEVSYQGSRKWVETYKAPIVNDEGVIFGTVGFARDISQRKEMEQQLQHIAHYDALTGLPNRVLKSDRLRQAMIHAERRNEKIAVVYLDLDGFKQVNDRYGHSIGDQLLIALSVRMQQALREGDTLSRLGGDEFVVILIDMDETSSALPVIQRLLDAASQTVDLDDSIVQVSASIGVTFYPQHEDVDADQLIRQADQAMYEAKQSGKNRYHIFDSEHDRTIRIRHEHLERIQQALDENEFVLYYQPKINMRTGELIGAEALIRWQHPTEGLIPPLDFLPIIENHPLSIKIGEWVINETITQIKQWQLQGLNLLVSVNVGAKQLLQGNFVQRLQWILAQHENFDAFSLKIEVLETSALEDVDLASDIIKECKTMGIYFALDDFGTGYSSLTYLKRLPVVTLKIDQSFVRDMLEDRDDLAILEGIIGLAKAFGREVIAEGVETNEHGKQLLLLGCDLAQGYGIARPMPSEKMVEWSQQWDQDHKWIV